MKIFPDKRVAKNAYGGSKVADARSGAWVYTGGVGSYYGSGFKNPIGSIRSDTVGYRPVSRRQLGKKPRSLA